MRNSVLGCVAVLSLCSLGASAQAPAPASTGGPAAEVQASYARFKDNILKAADKMPAADYGFKATPDIRSFTRIVNHITEAQLHTCTALNGTPFSAAAVPGDAPDKAAVMQGLRNSFAECDKAYGALTNANLTEMVQLGPMRRSRIGMAWSNVSHDNEQYAHLSLYLRLKGLVPPTSEK